MKRIVVFFLLLATSAIGLAQDEPCKVGYVVEPTTGTVLYERNANQPLPPASMVKMMTVLLTMESIDRGVLTLDSTVTVSAHASKMGGSQVYLKQGEQFTVRQLLAATMVHSANDAAMALAERVGGTGKAFVKLMNERARQLGLTSAEFHSPHGLPAGPGDSPDLLSAADLAKLGILVMKYPLIREFAATEQMPFRDETFVMYNPNHLLRTYSDATGIKTGYSVPAGFCVTASAHRGNMDLIAVVMGCSRKKDSFDTAAELMTDAFNHYHLVTPVTKGAALPPEIPIEGGAAKRVSAIAGDSATVVVKRGEEDSIRTTVGPIGATAPIRKGQQVGIVIIRRNGQPIARVPALAATDVARETWWQRLWPF